MFFNFLTRDELPEDGVGICCQATGGEQMLVPFGTKVVDTDGNAIGTLKHLVLDPQSRQVASLVVHQGTLNRREVIVPLGKVSAFGEDVRLALHADEIDALELFHAPHYQVMPDHWEMPLGFDQRDFFLVGGGGWTAAELPFETTSPTASGTPRFIADPVPTEGQEESDVAAGMHVFDSAGQRVGDVESVEFDPASGKIGRITIKRGFLFHTEVTIPASMIGSISDRVALNVNAETVKSLGSSS
jgi:sporulation protein YlmC with PRC-barrel domain